MTVPVIVSLHKWLQGYPGVVMPVLNADIFSSAHLQVVTNDKLRANQTSAMRVARLKRFKSDDHSQAEAPLAVWFDAPREYERFAEFVAYLNQIPAPTTQDPKLILIDYLLLHLEEHAHTIPAFRELFTIAYLTEAINVLNDFTHTITSHALKICPLLISAHHSAKRIAAFVICLLESLPAKHIIEQGLLHDFFVSNIGLEESEGAIRTCYRILRAFPIANDLVSQALRTSVASVRAGSGQNLAFKQYDLTGAMHPKEDELLCLSLTADPVSLPAPALPDSSDSSVSSPSSFQALHQFFGMSFMLNILKGMNQDLATLHTADQLFTASRPLVGRQLFRLFGRDHLATKQQREAQLQETISRLRFYLQNEAQGLSRTALIQLLHALNGDEERETWFAILVKVLDAAVQKTLLETREGAALHLLSFNPVLLAEMTTEALKAYLEITQVDERRLLNRLKQLHTLLVMLNDHNDEWHAADEKILLVSDEMIRILIAKPSYQDEEMVQDLAEAMSAVEAADIASKRDEYIQSINQQWEVALANVLQDQNFATLQDIWHQLFRNFTLLRSIMAVGEACRLPCDKYACIVAVIQFLKHAQAGFSLPETVRAIVPFEYPAEGQGVSEQERAIVEIMLAVHDESLWRASIHLLESEPIRQLDWMTRAYGGSTIEDRAYEKENVALSDFLARCAHLVARV